MVADREKSELLLQLRTGMAENPGDSALNRLGRLLPSSYQMKRTQGLTMLPTLIVIHVALVTQDDKAKSVTEDRNQMMKTNRSTVSRWIESEGRDEYH
jgi:hypothetical protein